MTMIDKEMEFRAARDRERSNLSSHKSGGGGDCLNRPG